MADVLDLSGLEHLNDDTARELCCSSNWLMLTGLQSLSEIAAEAIALKPGGCIELGQPVFLSDSTARRLCQCNCKVCIHDMTQLSESARQILQALPL